MPISHRAAYASVLNLMSISWIVLSENGIYKLFYNILFFVICWGVTPLCLSAMIGTWMVKSTNIAISSDLLYLTFIWLSFTFYLANFTVSFTSSTFTMLLVVFLLSLYIFDGNWKVRSRMRLLIKNFIWSSALWSRELLFGKFRSQQTSYRVGSSWIWTFLSGHQKWVLVTVS